MLGHPEPGHSFPDPNDLVRIECGIVDPGGGQALIQLLDACPNVRLRGERPHRSEKALHLCHHLVRSVLPPDTFGLSASPPSGFGVSNVQRPAPLVAGVELPPCSSLLEKVFDELHGPMIFDDLARFSVRPVGSVPITSI